VTEACKRFYRLEIFSVYFLRCNLFTHFIFLLEPELAHENAVFKIILFIYSFAWGQLDFVVIDYWKT
jgi:hypothetical protein